MSAEKEYDLYNIIGSLHVQTAVLKDQNAMLSRGLVAAQEEIATLKATIDALTGADKPSEDDIEAARMEAGE